MSLCFTFYETSKCVERLAGADKVVRAWGQECGVGVEVWANTVSQHEPTIQGVVSKP